jgi:alanyl-tRNA synthetase
MQFDEIEPGQRVPLPRPSIDTGMGLERMAALLQGVTSSFDIDLFRALVSAVAEATNTDPKGGLQASHRIIADHLRASAFLISDGVLPSNEGRGYVLRRIMRRAMRHAQILGARDPLMWRLVPALVREMGTAYPELVRAEALITETLRLEETRFRQTLARGLAILDDESRNLRQGAQLSGETAFRLYDTYGFPLDLTQDALRARGIGVDTAGFAAAMERQRREARKAWAGSGEAATETLWFALRDRAGATEFLGYETEEAAGIVTGLLADGAEVPRLNAGQSGAVIVNQTPFYGESGGQVGDTGLMSAPGVLFRVTDTQKKIGDVFVHSGILEAGEITLGQSLDLKVDGARRTAIRANHSATHLLHEALRQVLGDHVAQKGSLVAPDRLRFDFAHPKPISDGELAAIEDLANAHILKNTSVETRLMAVDEAIESGARALFGEKYGDEVRVVSMGGRDGANHPFSIELCGGTHVSRTGDIGLVSITGESAVAAGVRRLEAKTADAARHHLNEEAQRLREVASLIKASGEEAPVRLAALLDERKRLERELADARRKLAMGGASSGNGADQPVRDIAGIKLFARALQGVDMKDLKSLADEAKKTLGSGIVAIANKAADGKGAIVVGVTPDLTGRFNAVDFVRLACERLGGKGGGGRPDMAQAGGPDGTQTEAALQAVEDALRERAIG